jgi:nitroreductase
MKRKIMNTQLINMDDAVPHHISPQTFLSTPLSDEQLYEVLENAQFSSSNHNTQPWNVHIVSGNKKDELAKLIITHNLNNLKSSDLSFDHNTCNDYHIRSQEQIRLYSEILGVVPKREKPRKPKKSYLKNYQFFNAPHAAFLFMPAFGDHLRIASDIGMYAQSLLLSLTAHGYSGIPQTILKPHADIIKESLGISDDFQLLFGIAFGYVSTHGPTSNICMPRLTLEESITFHH